MRSLYTLSTDARASLRASGTRATSAIQMPTTSLLETRGSVSTTTLLHAMAEIRKSNPVRWWWLGETTEFITTYGPLAFDMRYYVPDLFTGSVHYGIYAGTPVFNSSPVSVYGFGPPDTVLILGPQVRQQDLEVLSVAAEGFPLPSLPWSIETIAVGLGGTAYVSFPDDGSVTFGPDEDFAVEGWVSTAVANCPVLAKADTGRWPYALDIVAGKARASRSDGTHVPAVTSTVTVNDSAWHYWLLSKDAGTLSLTIDETAVTTTDTTTGPRGATATSAAVTIGAGLYAGGVSHFAVYDRAVDATEAIRHRRAMLGIGVEV